MKNTNKGQGHVFFLTLISLILLALLIICTVGKHHRKSKVVKLKPVCSEGTCTQTYAKRDSGSDAWLYYHLIYSSNSTPDMVPASATWTRTDKAPEDEEIDQEVDEDQISENSAPESDPESDVSADDMDASDSSDMDSSSDSSDSSSDSSFDSGSDFGGGDAGGDGGGGGE
jgi:uncharacterized membrane protein YgcG